MKNLYEVRGNVTAIFINSRKYGKFETIISTDKLEQVKEFPGTWSIRFSKHNKSFYVQGGLPRENGKTKTKFLHHWVTGVPQGTLIDHRNHDTLDNTDLNLSPSTFSENGQNRKGAMSNSKSGVRNVCWERGKWRVQITVNKVHKYIGRFNNLEDAEHAAIEARFKYMPFSNEPI